MNLDDWRALLDYHQGDPIHLGIPPDIAKQLGVDLPPPPQPVDEGDKDMHATRPTLRPVIKWSGSKRPIASDLHALWPAGPNTRRYFEPFVGGGSMLPGRSSEAAVAGDYLEPLIELWRAIQSRPGEIADHYETIWKLRQTRGAPVFYEIRDRFNATKSPEDLMVLSRMCVNGLIRFNKKGDFNNSLHHTRPGIAPQRLREILQTWSRHLSGVRFQATDYEITLAEAREGDLAFLDPPYMKTRGRYRPDDFDFERLWSVLEKLNHVGAHWILTLDGSSGSRTYHQKGDVPSQLWRHALTVNTGNSPFTRLMGTSLDAVRERVYLNFDPPGYAVGEVSRSRALLDYHQGDPSHLGIPPDIARKLGVDLPPPPQPVDEEEPEEEDDMATKKKSKVKAELLKKKKHFDGATCAFKGCSKKAEGYVSAIKPTKGHPAGQLWYAPACAKSVKEAGYHEDCLVSLAHIAQQRDGASDIALILDTEVGDVLKRLEAAGIDDKGRKLSDKSETDYESPITEDQLNGTQQPQDETPTVVPEAPADAITVIAVSADVSIPTAEIAAEHGEGTQLLGVLQNFAISDQQGMDLASQLLADVKGKWKRLDEVRKHIGKPLRDKLKEIQAHFKPTLDLFEQAEGILKTKITEGSAQAAQVQAQALQAAQAAHAAGDMQTVIATTQAAAQADVQLPQGVHTRKVAKFQVVDPSQLPGDFWTPDLKKLQAYVDAGWREIPGVQIWEEDVVVSRAS